MITTLDPGALLARIAELKADEARLYPGPELQTLKHNIRNLLFNEIAPALEAMAQRERELVADNAAFIAGMTGSKCPYCGQYITHRENHRLGCFFLKEHPGSALLAEMESLRQGLADATHKLEVGEGAEGARGLKMLQNCMALAEIAPPQSLAAWITYTKSELEAAVQRADEAETKADDARVEKEGALCEVARANRAEARANKRAAEAERKLAQKTSELELAVQHDRQPYPTAEAYEKVCVALEKLKAELEHNKQSAFEAFVKGAKWWEFKKTGGTMWQSDQNEARAEAEKHYPFYGQLVEKLEAQLAKRDRRIAELECIIEDTDSIKDCEAVIRKLEADYEEVAAELARVRAALEWYADSTVYVPTAMTYNAIMMDKGKRARAALAPEPAPEGEKT